MCSKTYLRDLINLLSSEKKPGVYQIKEDILNGKKIARLTAHNDEHKYDKTIIVKNDKGQIVLRGVSVKRNCFKTALNIYSTTGFLLGTVKERKCKRRADYEICTGNQDVMYLLKYEPSSDVTITIKDKNNRDVVAEVSLCSVQNQKVLYSITYLEKITVLQKSLILTEVLAYSQQDRSAFQSTFNCYSKVKDIKCCRLCRDIKTQCCRLSRDRKTFFTMCFLFPLVIVLYFIFILLFVTYLICSLCTSICCMYHYGDAHEVISCVFTWPYKLCKDSEDICPNSNLPNICENQFPSLVVAFTLILLTTFLLPLIL